MMRKHLVICYMALLLVLLQTDAVASRRGSKSRGSSKPSRPSHSRPAHQPSRPAHQPNRPANKPSKPVHNKHVQPAQNPPPYNPAYAPQNPANPPRNPGNPPPYNPAYAPQNPAYPPRNPVNPPQNPAYPQNPGYQPQNPAFPAQHPGYPVRNPSNPHDPSWAQPWKPKNPKLKTKHVAGAAVAGAVVGAAGGFLMGRALSNMRFHFNNPDEERWWYEHRNRYSDRVYYPQYAQPVPEDTFVQDCWNVTVREFIEPSGNQMADEMESRVVRRVVREMCIEQYRSFSSRAGGGSLGPHESNPAGPRPITPGMRQVAGEGVTGLVVAEGGGPLLGSSWSEMHFLLNDSDEQQWWKDNQDRFSHQFYKPNYSQPLSKEAFVDDCVNVTVEEYLRPSGNQTADEMQTRVGTRIIEKMCVRLFHSVFSLTKQGGFAQSNKPEEPTMPAWIGMKHLAEPAIPGTAAGARWGSSPKSAASKMDHSFHVGNALHLSSPTMRLLLTLFLCFLIP
ncbi:uncharacterized protein LOC123027094 isoform X2 [Varanus komodoensis]|nr:uncharacterized protein LOC123027094 isoform X2 [Varanus komodoensis]